MKKKRTQASLLIAAFLLTAATISAATIINTPLIASFETEQDNPFDISYDTMDGTTTVVNNPATDGINNSEKCIKYTNTTANAQKWWGKIVFTTKAGITIQPASSNHRYLNFYAYSTCNDLRGEFGIKDIDGNTIKQFGYTLEQKNTWQKVVIDLGTAVQDKKIGQMYFAPNLGGIQPNDQYLIDEITLSDIAGEYYTSPILATFEDGFDSPFIMSQDGGTQSVITNTTQNGINNSAKSLLANYPNGSDWWHKIKLEAKASIVIAPQSVSHKYLHFMSYRSNPKGMYIEIQNKSGQRIYSKNFDISLQNTWEEIILDLTQPEGEGEPGINEQNIGKIWICPSAGGESANQYQFDSFVLSDSKDPIGNIRMVNNLCNFENDENWKNNIVKIGSQTEGATANITPNPLPDDKTNKTTHVLKYTRPEGGEWWHSLMLTANGYIGAGYPNSYLHFMMYNPDKKDITVLLADIQGHEHAVDFAISTQVEDFGWIDYVVDLDALDLTNLQAINFRIQTPGIYYIDEILINNEAIPRTGITTGSNKSEMNPVTVYTSEGHIIIQSTEIQSVNIYSVDGTLVVQQAIHQASVQFKLPTGIYMVKAKLANGKIESVKVIL